MTGSNIRIPIKQTISRKDMYRIALRHDWLLWDKIPQSKDHPFELIWIRQDEQTHIHYIEDYLLNVHYMIVEGRETDHIDHIVHQIHDTVATFSRTEIITMARTATTPAEHIRAISHVAALADQKTFDPELFALYQQTLAHPDPSVREATILAISYTDWTEFTQILTPIAAADPDHEVRQSAKVLLESFSVNFHRQEQ